MSSLIMCLAGEEAYVVLILALVITSDMTPVGIHCTHTTGKQVHTFARSFTTTRQVTHSERETDDARRSGW